MGTRELWVKYWSHCTRWTRAESLHFRGTAIEKNLAKHFIRDLSNIETQEKEWVATVDDIKDILNNLRGNGGKINENSLYQG